MARSTKRFIRNREHEFEYEKMLIAFFKRVNKKNIRNREYEKKEFGKLKGMLEQIQRKPQEKKAMSYFDFMAWINSKIAGGNYVDFL